jgi:AbiV family abortive infection protein
MANLTGAALIRGAWYAIEQCGLLLRDAVLLYDNGRAPTAIGLALFAREELGKSQILLELWNAGNQEGRWPTVAEVERACEDHAQKQRYAQGSITFQAGNETEIGKLMQRITTSSGPEKWEASDQLKELIRKKMKGEPERRVNLRESAFYVDPNISGTDWDRPHDLREAEAYGQLLDAVNNYSGRRDSLRPEMIRVLAEVYEKARPDDPTPTPDLFWMKRWLEGHPEKRNRQTDILRQLAKALEDWEGRPPLPEAIWPQMPTI